VLASTTCMAGDPSDWRNGWTTAQSQPMNIALVSGCNNARRPPSMMKIVKLRSRRLSDSRSATRLASAPPKAGPMVGANRSRRSIEMPSEQNSAPTSLLKGTKVRHLKR